MQVAVEYTHHLLVQSHMMDKFAAWLHPMDIGIVVDVAREDHMIGLVEQSLGKAHLLVDWLLEDHRIEAVLVVACHMMVAYHTAVVGDNLVVSHPGGKQPVDFHVLHKDSALEHDFHTSHRHTHAHSPAEDQSVHKVDDAHNLDHVAVHNCN